MNPQAEELNNIIKECNPVVFDLLSEKGKNIFFPKKGILGQSADAKGKRINATIGTAIEDDGSPIRLASIEKQINIAPENAFPYAPSYGRPDIRSKWQEMIYKKNPSLKGVTLSNPVVTNALTHGLSMIGYLFCDEGDSIILSDLFWGNYNLIFSQAYKTNFITFDLFDNAKLNLDSIKAKVLDSEVNKKVILLNFPNNPTGYSPTTGETNEIASIILQAAEKGNKIAVICDDAYFGLVYEEGIEEESIFAKLATLHENVLAIKVDGPTKEDYVWGFRTGFITYSTKNGTPELYSALEAKTAGAVRGNISNACNMSQSILLNAFESGTYDQEKSEKFQILKGRCNKVQTVLKDSKYEEFFKSYPFNSGYFMCVKLNDNLDGEAIRMLLNNKYETGIINFNNIFRIAFSSVAESSIQELFDNIYSACKESVSKQ